jgi:hypothetical protein
VQQVLNSTRPGQTVMMYVLRGGVSVTLSVKLDAATATNSAIAPLTPAPVTPGPAAGAPAPQGTMTSVAEGSYECWAWGQARMGMNFTVKPGGRYVDSEGRAGTYHFDAPSQRITFKGGILDGVLGTGFYAIYYAPNGRPTVSFRNKKGDEDQFCERMR